jgi:outer membrane protein OmpA-like peptidoglycan-associated protein
MRLNWMAAGMSAALLALAASAPLAFAQTSGSYLIAQAGDDALAEAQAIIAEAGNIQSLSEDELKQRIKKARQLSRSEGLPDDIKEGLKSFVSAARQELVARESQQQQQQQTEQPPAEQPQPEQQTEQPPPPQPEQQVTQPEAAPSAPAVDDKALAQANQLLSEARPSSELSVDELKQRMRQARRLSTNENLPADVRDQLKGIVDASRQELVARESQQQQQQQTEQPPPPPPQPEQQVEQPPSQPEQQATPAPELKVEQPEQQVTQPEAAPSAPAAAVDDKALAQANKLLSDPRPSSELSVNDLRERIRQARRLTANENLPSDVRDQLKGIVEASRQEIVSRETKTESPAEQPPPAQAEIANVQQAAPPPSTAENRAIEQPKVSNAAEEQAQKFLADNTPLDRLKDEQIRDRLDAYRDLLNDGDLSRPTERMLRRKLQDERQALRARIGSREFAKRRQEPEEQQAGPDTYDSGQVKISRYDERPARREMQFIINDRRPLRSLSDLELQRRIIVFRELSSNDRYSESQLLYIRTEMTKARRELRRRFEEEKLVRGRDLDRRRRNNDLDIDINVNLGGGSAPPPVIWAAEEDDEEIEQQLVRRPIRKLERTYDRDELIEEPEVILTRPEVRESLPGVEIDTIRFGFNEAFVREEEVQNLDRIGAIIERVVTAHPKELFVVEGHTDAVGTDEYNLKLSKQRAEAVRQILLEFYNIGEENVITVGLGERYLKIPTPDPEQENRRVTIRRGTPLLSEYEPDEE